MDNKTHRVCPLQLRAVQPMEQKQIFYILHNHLECVGCIVMLHHIQISPLISPSACFHRPPLSSLTPVWEQTLRSLRGSSRPLTQRSSCFPTLTCFDFCLLCKRTHHPNLSKGENTRPCSDTMTAPYSGHRLNAAPPETEWHWWFLTLILWCFLRTVAVTRLKADIFISGMCVFPVDTTSEIFLFVTCELMLWM